jgi:hypothetical protein
MRALPASGVLVDQLRVLKDTGTITLRGKHQMWQQTCAAGGVVGLALAGLIGSKVMCGRRFPAFWARRAASALGGLAYLIAVLWMEVAVALAVLGALTLLILLLRLVGGSALRGVHGCRSSQAWSEVTYPIAGTLSLAVGWGLLGDRWLGFAPVAFMAWGDNACGLVRDTCGDWIARVWPSAAMFAVCLCVAGLIQPYWLGALGAAAATVAERFRPPVPIWDDNLNLVTASLVVMTVVSKITG